MPWPDFTSLRRRWSRAVTAGRVGAERGAPDHGRNAEMLDNGDPAWFAGKEFSTDWTSVHFPTWTRVLADRRGTVADVLEIGSWEGRSAVFFLNYFPGARIACIDPFTGSAEHADGPFAKHLPDVERRFDHNLAEFGDRVEKIKMRSSEALAHLAIAGRRFDFVYIDGSHRAVDVYCDAALAWTLVKRGGAILFDDYTWIGMPDEMDRPKLGIDAFLRAMEGSYRKTHHELQVLIEKIR